MSLICRPAENVRSDTKRTNLGFRPATPQTHTKLQHIHAKTLTFWPLPISLQKLVAENMLLIFFLSGPDRTSDWRLPGLGWRSGCKSGCWTVWRLQTVSTRVQTESRFARISFLSRLSGSHFLWWCHHLCFLQLPRTPLNLLCKPEWTSCISRLESWPTLAFDLGGDKVKQQHFWVKSPLPRRRCTSQGEVWWLYSSFRLLFSLGNFQKYQSVCWVTLGGIFAHTGLGRWSPWRQLSFLFFPLGNVQHRALRGDASEVSTNKEKV